MEWFCCVIAMDEDIQLRVRVRHVPKDRDTLKTNDMRISWLIVDGRILERVIESIKLGRQAD